GFLPRISSLFLVPFPPPYVPFQISYFTPTHERPVMSANDAECLVAREVPAKEVESPSDDIANILSDKISALDINHEEKKEKKKEAASKTVMQPANFMAMQSLRSSALARKTNTSQKFGKGSQSLMADLLNEEKKEEKKEDVNPKKEDEKKEEGEEKSDKKEEKDKKEKKGGDEEDEEEDVLISRGPVRAARQTVAPHHPYGGVSGSRYANYGSTPTTDIGDYTSYSAFGQGYECGTTTWQNLGDSPDMAGYISSSSTPDTVQSSSAESGYSSCSPMTFSSPSYSPADATVYQGATTNVQRILTDNDGDMPDNVSEFILAYSTMLETESKENMIYCRPPSTDSSCVDSPMSAGSAPHFSPGQPQSGNTGRISPASVIPISTDRPARQRLRVHIGQDNTEQAMLWMCKCVQGCNVASRTSMLVEKKEGETILFWQDKDKDTFLHICLLNLDVAKAYAIIEQQLKQERKHAEFPPWDLRNRFDESPLFIAVQNRQTLFVDYLLELNADPNVQSNRNQRETALMHAATRGMNDIVKTLVRDPRTKKEMENEDRMSALHLAVWNNGIFDEATQSIVDNLEVVKTLLEAGSDCSKVLPINQSISHFSQILIDKEDRKSSWGVFHQFPIELPYLGYRYPNNRYAGRRSRPQRLPHGRAEVRRNDARGKYFFLDIFLDFRKSINVKCQQLARYIPDDMAVDLANRMDSDGQKPINILEKYTGKIDQQLYQSCFFALLTCNANVERHSPIPGEQAK
ncbi:nfki-1, partial [Pristionchus pacificus]|uniref:Nbid-1 n=1 Tax=Pristionchus pacificus TaxID=54126 RepID=A0A2A6D1J4_PRIPA